MRRKISWTNGQTDKGKTVYSPLPSGSRGIITRADNSGYTNHRVICLVVIGSSFDSEQVFQVSNGYL
jgi:hypothetical protein